MKKIISFFCMIMVFLSVSASAFTFPEPDWGALLQEKTNMVNGIDFELFVEGPVEAAPYYGAKLEPRGGTYFGMIAENSRFLGPVSYLTYFSMDDRQTDIYYPANDIIRQNGGVVTIGYTVNSLDSVDYDVIRKSLNTLSGYNRKMFIRFANEMNVSSLGDDPERYKEVFRNVANMVHEYDNFAVVWSPNDLGGLDRPFEYYYPGDEYVDWVGVSSYMKKYFGGNKNTAEKDSIYFMTGDYAWATNALKPIITFMEKNGIQKPVMISECGVATENLYNEDCKDWATPRFRNLYYNVIMKYPQVKLINYFNVYRDEKERYYVNDVHNNRGTSKDYAIEIMNQALYSGAYIRQNGGTPEFVYTPANSGYTIKADDGIINLHTLCYIPKVPDAKVTYYIDGEWVGERQYAPYTYTIRMNDLADGNHTVKIVSNGMEKTYNFTKRVDAICFGGEPEGTYVIENVEQNGQSEIKVLVNGTPVLFDTAPIIVDDRTLVPVRAIFEALGANVNWEGKTRTVIANGYGKTVRLTIGEKKMYVNGAEKELDVPASIYQDRTLVPVRAISESFDCGVNWDGATRTVVINQ